MGKGEIYAQRLESDNLPSFIKKNVLIDSNNYLHDKWREDKDRMYSKIYFALSLFLTILASFLIEYLGWIPILLLADILTFLLIIFAKRYNNQKERFEDNRKKMKGSFNEWGLEWRD